ncbi:MAG: cupin domain-containing protein [Pseudomonadota bacterium]
MRTIRILSCCFVMTLAGAVTLSVTVNASDLIHREVLKRVDLTGSDKTEVIVTRVTIAPGGKVPRHSHHGDEFVYVTEGGTASVPGRPPIKFEAGQTIHFPRGKLHGGFTVTGSNSIKAVTTHIVDKGKPFSVPAK